MSMRQFFTRFLTHTTYALACFTGLAYMAERLAPASILPFLPLHVFALATLILVAISIAFPYDE